jgi:hypothetical protein
LPILIQPCDFGLPPEHVGAILPFGQKLLLLCPGLSNLMDVDLQWTALDVLAGGPCYGVNAKVISPRGDKKRRMS